MIKTNKMKIKKLIPSILLIVSFSTISNSQVPNYVTTNGLLSWWSFSGNGNDGSGNGNVCIINGATLTTDRLGNPNSAYYFNGINNYIDATVSNIPLANKQRTISGWFKTDAPINTSQPYICILNYGTLVNGQRFSLNIYNGKGYLETTNGFEFTNEYDFYINNYNYLSNDWYFFTYTYDGSKTSLYVNGNFINGINEKLVNLNTISTNNLFRIGERISGDNGDEFFKGTIDDIGIWNRVLTPEEITNLYNNSLGVNDFKQNTTISIYPNPTTNVLNFKSNANMINSDYTIYDQSGKIMKIGKITHENTSIQLNNLPNGIYLLNVENIKQTFKVLKE